MPEGVNAGPDSLGPLMDAQVPAVVAVVVTTGPGIWLEEALSSLAAQDYEEMAVLVLSAGDDDPAVTARVARVLPDAFVRHLPGRPSYAAASNEALGMVEGAAFFLLLHDDVALDPDAVHKLVEESFRSNAGVVSPKFVHWDDPRVLLHVGMSCDKTGAVVDRVIEGEVDHGQHDAVRDVFVAPGGCILIRADLFSELKGFDAGIVAMGEDLDLSWRSQVAGSRVVVAPEARVRHREAVASGLEPLMVADEAAGRHPATLQSLQRRHELRAVLKCYTRLTLLRVLPQAALLAFGEYLVALLAATATGLVPSPVPGVGTFAGPLSCRCCGANWPNIGSFPIPRCAGFRCEERAALELLQPPLPSGPECRRTRSLHGNAPSTTTSRPPGWPSSPGAWVPPSARTRTSTTSTTWAGDRDGTASGGGSGRRP